MSNDIYQQRQFFEPDKRFKLSNGWEFKGTTLSFDKDKIERVSMKGIRINNPNNQLNEGVFFDANKDGTTDNNK